MVYGVVPERFSHYYISYVNALCHEHVVVVILKYYTLLCIKIVMMCICRQVSEMDLHVNSSSFQHY